MTVEHEGKLFGNHYMAMVSDEVKERPNIIVGDTLSILANHNGTNVMVTFHTHANHSADWRGENR